ncbi:MAG: hypothetical protein V4556_09255 [Bacteroidota bacterium]
MENSFAQKENSMLMSFAITDYIVKLSDSMDIVQIQLSDGLAIKEKSMGVLQPKRIPGDADTIEIGFGKCHLIKGDYYYFSIRRDKKARAPKKGDLLYTTLNLPDVYEGNLYHVAKHAVTFIKIDETPLMTFSNLLSLKSKADEDNLISSFIEEIKFTAKTMIEQNEIQDMVIATGTYKGKKLFETMQLINNKDIIDFLKYINARPALYAGYEWKFSEVFATWMSEGAPTVKGG